MKKTILTLFLVVIASCFVNAQDLIVLKDANEIEAKVEAVTQTEISYRKWSNQDGPLFTISKSEVFYIKYQNGEKEIISEQPAVAGAATASSQASKQNYVGTGVNSVDAKSYNKIVFTYSPMTWKSGGISSNNRFHNIGLLYTNSQLIARVPLYIEFGAGINWLTSKTEATEETKYHEYSTKNKFNMFSLTIPVNIVYSLSFKGGQMHLAPYTGFYARLNIAGSQKVESEVDGEVESTSINLFSKDDMGDGAFKRFQLGWQLGLAFDYKMLNVFLGYGVDILPLQKFEGEGLAVKSSLSGVNLGIGLKF